MDVHYSIEHHHDDAIMVITATPTERWEILFHKDGAIEGEQFISKGFQDNLEPIKQVLSYWMDKDALENEINEYEHPVPPENEEK